MGRGAKPRTEPGGTKKVGTYTGHFGVHFHNERCEYLLVTINSNRDNRRAFERDCAFYDIFWTVAQTGRANHEGTDIPHTYEVQGYPEALDALRRKDYVTRITDRITGPAPPRSAAGSGTLTARGEKELGKVHPLYGPAARPQAERQAKAQREQRKALPNGKRSALEFADEHAAAAAVGREPKPWKGGHYAPLPTPASDPQPARPMGPALVAYRQYLAGACDRFALFAFLDTLSDPDADDVRSDVLASLSAMGPTEPALAPLDPKATW